MFTQSLWLSIAKPFAKIENELEDQYLARLTATKQTPHIEKMIEESESESELDEPRECVSKQGTKGRSRETESNKEKAPLLRSQEVGDTRGDDNDLNSDSKKLYRLEIRNRRLISELADAKLSAETLSQNYEEERKARKMLEDKCVNLEKKVTNAVKKLEIISRKSELMREEFEKERDNITIAMHMQRDSLQMKEEDAKLILERKYEELDDLRRKLEAFVGKNCGNNATEAVREAEVLLEAVHALRYYVKVTSYPRRLDTSSRNIL